MASPADINLICCTSTDTETDITGDGISYTTNDTFLNTSGERTSNPITIPAADQAFSYEKWLKFQCGTTEPDTQCTNFKFWGSGEADIESAKILDYYKVTVTREDPALATTNATYTTVKTATSAAKVDVAGTLNSAADDTSHVVMMLEVAAGSSQGNITQQTYNYQYDEN